MTKAIEVQPTPEDETMLRDLDERNARSERDRELMASVMREKKAEEARLRQARGEVERMQAR